MNAWAGHQIQVFEKVLRGETPDLPVNTTRFNQESYEHRKNLTWEEVYQEFLETSKKLASLAGRVPEDMWIKRVWPDRPDKPQTLKRNFEIEIKHFREEHIPDIRRLVGS